MKNKKLWQGPKITAFSIALLGILTALRLVVSRIGSIRLTRDIRISLAFIVTVIIAYYFGPLWTAVFNGIMNLLIFFLFPTGDPFFIGYTLSAIIGGFIYGLFLYPYQLSWIRTILAVVLVTLIVNLFLNALWATMLYQVPFWISISSRLIKELIQLVPQIVISYLTLQIVSKLKIESKLN